MDVSQQRPRFRAWPCGISGLDIDGGKTRAAYYHGHCGRNVLDALTVLARIVRCLAEEPNSTDAEG
jgi:hypothetical protein